MKIQLNTTIKGISLLLFSCLVSAGAWGQYCTPTYSTQCNNFDMYIQSFSTTGGKTTNITHNNSGCDNPSNSYKYNSNSVHDGIQGTVVNFSVKIGVTYPQGVKIFVDYNIDGDFDDNGEQVWVSNGNIPGNGTATGSFTIPPNATVGDSRLRIRSSYSTTTFTACQAQSYGECEDHKFVILPSCTADFPLQPADIGVCESQATMFTANTVNAQQFQWQLNAGSGWVNLGDDAVYGGTATTNLTVKNATIGMHGYKYRLVAINTNDNCDVKSDEALLTLVPTTPSSIVLSAQPSTDICANEQAILYTSYTNGGTTPQYKWLLNGLEIPGEKNATLKINTLDQGDVVQCIFISSKQCVFPKTSGGVKFSVVSGLVAEVDLTANYNGNNSYTFIAEPTNGGVAPEYFWYVNGKLLPGEKGQSYTTETLQPWDKVTVGMLSSRDCASPRYATSKQTTTGISGVEHTMGELVVAPNPNRGSFTIQADRIQGNHASLSITNTLGQLVYSAEVEVNNGNLHHSVNMQDNIPSGMYVVRIEAGNSRQILKFTVAD